MHGARAGVLFAVPREARAVSAEWDRLAEASVRPPVFGPELIKDLPEPARRWLAHSIAPGTPLWRTAVGDLACHSRERCQLAGQLAAQAEAGAGSSASR